MFLGTSCSIENPVASSTNHYFLHSQDSTSLIWFTPILEKSCKRCIYLYLVRDDGFLKRIRIGHMQKKKDLSLLSMVWNDYSSSVSKMTYRMAKVTSTSYSILESWKSLHLCRLMGLVSLCTDVSYPKLETIIDICARTNNSFISCHCCSWQCAWGP